MNPETMDEYEVAGGQLACHRKHLLIIPGPLGKLSVVHQPCNREKCALWDPKDNQCLDVTNADTLKLILRTLVALEDRLPPELP